MVLDNTGGVGEGGSLNRHAPDPDAGEVAPACSKGDGKGPHRAYAQLT
jgi:hypothetical protein